MEKKYIYSVLLLENACLEEHGYATDHSGGVNTLRLELLKQINTFDLIRFYIVLIYSNKQ